VIDGDEPGVVTNGDGGVVVDGDKQKEL